MLFLWHLHLWWVPVTISPQFTNHRDFRQVKSIGLLIGVYHTSWMEAKQVVMQHCFETCFLMPYFKVFNMTWIIFRRAIKSHRRIKPSLMSKRELPQTPQEKGWDKSLNGMIWINARSRKLCLCPMIFTTSSYMAPKHNQNPIYMSFMFPWDNPNQYLRMNSKEENFSLFI